jgi:hypothetical protein
LNRHDAIGNAEDQDYQSIRRRKRALGTKRRSKVIGKVGSGGMAHAMVDNQTSRPFSRISPAHYLEPSFYWQSAYVHLLAWITECLIG